MKTPLESTAIHEFGHQYFYGLLASNEFEEAWLDEGMTSYLESRIMDDAYGSGSELSVAGLEIGSRDRQRLSYTKNDPSQGSLYGYAWEYSFGEYGKVSYVETGDRDEFAGRLSRMGYDEGIPSDILCTMAF